MNPYTRVLRSQWRLVLLALLPLLLYGCGGGGANNIANNESAALTGEIEEPVVQPTEPEDPVPEEPLPPVILPGLDSIRLHNYCNWTFANTEGWSTNQMIEVLARRDVVCFTERWPSEVTPSTLRAINPSIRVYRYYSLCIKSQLDVDGTGADDGAMATPVSKADIDANDWWLRNDSGGLIPVGDSANYLDVGKAGFKEKFLSNLLTRLEGKGFDGVVLDGWHPKMVWDTKSAIIGSYATDLIWFETAWQPFISYVASGLRAAGYKVVGNCAGEYGVNSTYYSWQRSQLDGTVYEQGAVDWRSNDGAWLPGATIERRINALKNDPLDLWFANNGIRPDTPDYEAKILVSLAVYLAGVPLDQSLRSYNYAGDWTVSWNSLYDFNIGAPASDAVKPVSTQYFWVRQFTQGIVLLNYDSVPATYTLTQSYVDPAGNTVSGTVTLPAYRAMILKTPGPN